MTVTTSEPETHRVLCSSVLVLNRYYMAVHVVSVRRAFILLYRELAEIIDIENGHYANYDFDTWCEMSELQWQEREDRDEWVRTVNLQIQVPRVIRLLYFDRPARQAARFSRRSLFARDRNCCQYCGKSLPISQLSLDHVIPRSRGGETSWENVVCSCVACNTRKGGRTPQEARMKLISKPARPKLNPLMTVKLENPKYEVWKSFLPAGHTPDRRHNAPR